MLMLSAVPSPSCCVVHRGRINARLTVLILPLPCCTRAEGADTVAVTPDVAEAMFSVLCFTPLVVGVAQIAIWGRSSLSRHDAASAERSVAPDHFV